MLTLNFELLHLYCLAENLSFLKEVIKILNIFEKMEEDETPLGE